MRTSTVVRGTSAAQSVIEVNCRLKNGPESEQNVTKMLLRVFFSFYPPFLFASVVVLPRSVVPHSPGNIAVSLFRLLLPCIAE